MKFVSYKNGNYNVHINLEDGTKIRENKLDYFEPDTIESMDIKITNKCLGPMVSYIDELGQPSFRNEPCPMCHENSGPNGKHADLTFEGTFLDKLHPYTELACLSGDTIVYTKNGATKIKDINEGDFIFDSTGVLCKVNKIVKSTKQVYELNASHGIKIKCSDDHPFLVKNIQLKAIDCVGKVLDVISNTNNILTTHSEVIDMANYVNVRNPQVVSSRGGIIEKDKVKLSSSSPWIPRHIQFNKEFMWLYGLFVAEGSRNGLTLNINEDKYANRAAKIWNQTLGLSTSISNTPKKHSQQVDFQSRKTVNVIFEQILKVGHGARNKNLSYLYSITDKEYIKEAILGLFDGDGCYRLRKWENKTYPMASLKTTSYKLAYDILYLMARYFGLYGTLTYGISKSRKIENRILPETDYYNVEFYGNSILDFFGDRFDKENINYTLVESPKSMICKEIKQLGIIDDLYDITLDSKTHIFPCNGYILTHNCGGGNPLEHPQLVEFLEECKKRKFIPSMTVNQSHLFDSRSYELVKKLVNEKLIYGLGISFRSANSYLKKYVEEFPNAVVHIINGLITEENLRKLKDFHCKVLVLGYKTFRRGELLYQRDSERIEKNKAMLNNLLPTIIKENWFEVISFDNLALEQLDVKDLMTKDQWEEFYLGDDGIGDEYNSASMYVDMVERKFAKNSCSVERFDLLDTVEDMYQFLKNRKMEK